MSVNQSKYKVRQDIFNSYLRIDFYSQQCSFRELRVHLFTCTVLQCWRRSPRGFSLALDYKQVRVLYCDVMACVLNPQMNSLMYKLHPFVTLGWRVVVRYKEAKYKFLQSTFMFQIYLTFKRFPGLSLVWQSFTLSTNDIRLIFATSLLRWLIYSPIISCFMSFFFSFFLVLYNSIMIKRDIFQGGRCLIFQSISTRLMP